MTTDLVSAIHHIATNIGAAAARPACCTVCGCLNRPEETCPNCALTSANKNRNTTP